MAAAKSTGIKKKPYTAHVAESKKKTVQELNALIAKYPIIAILNLENLPTRQLQKMKGKLRKDCDIKMAKKNLIKEAFNKSDKKDLKKLNEYLTGMPALLLTKENPFRLYKILKQSKSAAAIKPGQISPKDITVPAGPTPFAPGPIIAELGAMRIKAGIEGGKVVVKQDAVVIRKGEVASAQLSSLLLRLGVEPMEIGLNLVAVYENGEVLNADVLDIDQDVFMEKLQGAARDAMNLAVDIAYPSKDTILLLIGKSFRDSRLIAVERDILADLVVEQIIAKADAQANAVSGLVNK